MKKVAVLIPTYKPGSYFEECLQSLDKQTLSKKHFTVYIALNGPKENFEKYIKKILLNYTFNYNYYYIKTPGVSNARNFLLDVSTEEFVTFIDDDDLVSDNYLKMLLLEAGDSYMSVSNVKNFSESLETQTENYIGKSFNTIQYIELSKFKTRKFYSSPWGKLIHRNIIGNVKFNCNLSIGEDSLFMAEISNNVIGLCKAHDSVCYFVREREGSATRTKIKRYKELKRIFYLLFVYSKMLFTPKYGKFFIISRIVATLKHFEKLIRVE